jgi:hypothetical protein
MVAEEIVGFSVRHKADRMSLLLEVMTKMDAPGRVPQPFAAHDKQYPHFLISSRTGCLPALPQRHGNFPGRSVPQECPDRMLQYRHFIVDGVSLSIMRITVMTGGEITTQPLTGCVKKGLS